jgi:hypothetical protein
MWPFLKELVKRKRLPSGWLRNGSAGRAPLFPGVRRARGLLLSYRRLVIRPRDGCRRFATGSCHRSSRGDCSQHIPSRGTAHDSREQLRRGRGPGGRGFVWREFLAVRATPTKASCCRHRPSRARAAASRTHLELAQTGGILSCLTAAQIEQPGRSVVPFISSLLCPVRQPLRGDYNTFGLGGG